MTGAELLPAALRGRYRARRELGRGGFGRVVEAEDLELGRAVAVKLLGLRDADGAMLERFRAEARLTARVRHPAVVRVYDYGVAGEDGPFIVYELLPGGDILQARARGAADAEVLGWGVRIATALGAVHAEGLVHRDVKPENVLLGEGGAPVLADFGIARDPAAGARRTPSGIILGTVAYLAPEIWLGAAPTAAADQYAWAASLFSLLYGVPPRPAGSPAEAIASVQGRCRVLVPGSARGRWPAAEAALLRALEFESGSRFPAMEAFARALEAETPTQAAVLTTRDPGTRAARAPGEPRPRPQHPGSPGSSRRSRAAAALLGLVGLWLWMLRSGPGAAPAAPVDTVDTVDTVGAVGSERSGASGEPGPSPLADGFEQIVPELERLRTLHEAPGQPTLVDDPVGHLAGCAADLTDPRQPLRMARFLDAHRRLLARLEPHLPGTGSGPWLRRDEVVSLLREAACGMVPHQVDDLRRLRELLGGGVAFEKVELPWRHEERAAMLQSSRENLEAVLLQLEEWLRELRSRPGQPPPILAALAARLARVLEIAEPPENLRALHAAYLEAASAQEVLALATIRESVLTARIFMRAGPDCAERRAMVAALVASLPAKLAAIRGAGRAELLRVLVREALVAAEACWEEPKPGDLVAVDALIDALASIPTGEAPQVPEFFRSLATFGGDLLQIGQGARLPALIERVRRLETLARPDPAPGGAAP